MRLKSSGSAIPAYFLYGEALQAPDERLVHIETIAARSQLHDWTIRAHRHRDLHQVFLIRRGSVEVHLDGESRSTRPPAAIVVPPGAVHSFEFEPGTKGFVISFARGLVRELARVSPALIETLDRPLARSLDRRALDATDSWVLAEMLLREFGRSAPGRHLALRGLLGALLANLVRLAGTATSQETTPLPARELVARFRESLERRFRTHISVAAYAAELGASESTLRRACLAVVGEAPLEMLQLRLLIEAERQLRYTSMPVAQVAFFLGFDDPAYFSRFFVRRMGLTPREFRTRDGLEAESRRG
jgi:AraC family transcriptional regulator, transcriptional activator of pobA